MKIDVNFINASGNGEVVIKQNKSKFPDCEECSTLAASYDRNSTENKKLLFGLSD